MESKKLVKSNSRKAEKYRGSKCLNCGNPLELSDRYCSYCSQLNTSKQLDLKDFFGEFISSVLTYDSRLRYTIHDLLFKPGTISKNFVRGQRLKYANPFRFFLSVSIIYFLLNSLIVSFSDDASPIFNINRNEKVDTSEFDEEEKLALEKINNSLKKQNLSPILVDSLLTNKSAIDSLAKRLEKKTTNRIDDSTYTYYSEAQLDTMGSVEQFVKRFNLYRNFFKEHKITRAEIALDSLNHENTRFNRWVYDKNNSVERILDDPSGFFNYLIGKIPFFLFFFAPLFAVFFWLFYSRKKYTYLEHLVLIFHLFSFLFLALLLCMIPDVILKTNVFSSILMIFIGPFYIYKSLRNFYEQSRLKTIIKFILLNFVFSIISTIAAIIFFLFTAAIY